MIKVTHVVAEAGRSDTTADAVREALIAALTDQKSYLLRFGAQQVEIDPDRFVTMLCMEVHDPSKVES